MISVSSCLLGPAFARFGCKFHPRPSTSRSAATAEFCLRTPSSVPGQFSKKSSARFKSSGVGFRVLLSEFGRQKVKVVRIYGLVRPSILAKMLHHPRSPRGPKVVPFGGSYIKSYKVTPKRNYFGASG